MQRQTLLRRQVPGCARSFGGMRDASRCHRDLKLLLMSYLAKAGRSAAEHELQMHVAAQSALRPVQEAYPRQAQDAS